MHLPRLLLVVEDPKRRLTLITQLRARFDVLVSADKPPSVRRIREQRPELVLLSLGRRAAPGLRLCLSLKTDRRPPRVVVLDPHGASEQEAVLDTHLADAYGRGQLSPEQILELLDGREGARTVTGPIERSLLSRLLRR
ncbi:MAG: hypothetical protein VX899_10875 [Myxococcota bacterium]|nr:hypothetical protein [Myxococcota bacterium]